MHDFETFQDIFRFFVESKLNKKYVENIDKEMSTNTASPETKKLIEQVQTFHTMRQQLCGQIFEHLNNHPLLHEIIPSVAVEQYDSVAHGSVCAFTGQTMTQKQGMTLVLGTKNSHIVTIHKRFKQLLYNFWYLVHFVDEIMQDINNWLSTQRWWLRGYHTNITERIVRHRDSNFAKKAYVKLKSINSYIQRDMVSLPINRPL